MTVPTTVAAKSGHTRGATGHTSDGTSRMSDTTGRTSDATGHMSDTTSTIGMSGLGTTTEGERAVAAEGIAAEHQVINTKGCILFILHYNEHV